VKRLSWFSAKLVRRLTGPALLLGVLAVLLLSLVTYYKVRALLEESVADQLRLTVDLQEKELQRWIEDQKTAVIFISRAPFVRERVADLLSHQKDHTYYQAAYRELSEFLFSYIKNFPGLREISILSGQGGQVLFSTTSEYENEFRANETFFLKGQKDLYLQGVTPWQESTQPTITIARPLLNALGEKQGVLVVHLNLERMVQVVSHPLGVNQTGEVYLVDRNNTFITAGQFGREEFPRGVHTFGIDRALAGREGIAEYENYRGIPVVGFYRWLPELDVAILAEIHQDEAFFHAWQVGFGIAGFGLIVILFLAAGNIFSARRVVRPLEEMAAMVQDVTTGDLSIRIPVTGHDETSLLAAAFNNMVNHLQVVHAELVSTAENFKSIFDLSPSAIAVQRFDTGVFVHVNESFCRKYKVNEQDALGRSARDLGIWASDIDYLRVTATLRNKGAVDEFETVFIDGEGKAFPGIISSRVLDLAGKENVLSIMLDVSELRAAEARLRFQKELLQLILDSIPAPIYFKDAHGVYLGCNQAFSAYIGRPVSEIVGRTVYEIAPPEKAKVYEAADRHLLEQGGIQIYEAKVRFADGSDRDVVFHKAVFQNPDGTIGGLVGNMLDVTEIRTAEEELAAQELSYREIFNAATEAIFIRDLETKELIDVNQAMLDMYGYSYDEALHLTIDDMASGEPPYVAETAIEYMEQGVEGAPQLFEWHARKKDGTLFWVEIALKRVLIQGKTRILSVVRDITSRKQAEQAQRESDERFQLLIEHAADALFLHDKDGVILTVNQRSCDILGYRREELLGMRVDEIDRGVPLEEMKAFWGTLEPGCSELIEGEHVRKDGSHFPVDVNVVKFEFQGAYFFLALARDVSERKTTEQELERYRDQLEALVRERTEQLENTQAELVMKEKMAVLGQLTATVSHELRNPLGTVRNAIHLLGRLKDVDEPEKYARALEMANRNVNRCDGIISELLDYTRKQDWAPIRVDAAEWLAAVLDEQQVPADVKVTRSWEKGMVVACDPERFRRAVVNIYSNALHALQDIDSRAKTLKVKISRDSGKVAFSFIDNGTGMDAETLTRIFEPMYSTKNFGVGLGMPIVKNIMEEHGGGIEVSSRPGKGTTVTLWLPGA